MIDDLALGAQDLVLAVFRLAVSDYLGVAYGHDEPGPDKHTRVNLKVQAHAAQFLMSQWASHLGDLAGLSAQTVWKEVHQERLRADHLLRPVPHFMPDVSRSHRRIDESHGKSEWWLRAPQDGAAA